MLSLREVMKAICNLIFILLSVCGKTDSEEPPVPVGHPVYGKQNIETAEQKLFILLGEASYDTDGLFFMFTYERPQAHEVTYELDFFPRMKKPYFQNSWRSLSTWHEEKGNTTYRFEPGKFTITFNISFGNWKSYNDKGDVFFDEYVGTEYITSFYAYESTTNTVTIDKFVEM